MQAATCHKVQVLLRYHIDEIQTCPKGPRETECRGRGWLGSCGAIGRGQPRLDSSLRHTRCPCVCGLCPGLQGARRPDQEVKHKQCHHRGRAACDHAAPEATQHDLASLLQDRLCGARDKLSVSHPFWWEPLWCVETSIEARASLPGSLALSLLEGRSRTTGRHTRSMGREKRRCRSVR